MTEQRIAETQARLDAYTEARLRLEAVELAGLDRDDLVAYSSLCVDLQPALDALHDNAESDLRDALATLRRVWALLPGETYQWASGMERQLIDPVDLAAALDGEVS